MAVFFRIIALFFLAAAPVLGGAVQAQDNAPPAAENVIEVSSASARDTDIAERIESIFAEIDSLANVRASVAAGVVTLSGETQTADAAARAEAIAARISGVVTVENEIERDVSVATRLNPAAGRAEFLIRDVIRFMPLLLLAVATLAVIATFGWLIAGWTWFWRRVTPNPFIAELIASTARTVFFLLGAVAALSLLDATALLGAFLGAAGVIGLAVGFAVRDTIENYIASIMLSLRQPFRPNDHVIIDTHEGHVIRLTSRATILMTLEGNHLRIPNAAVFKAVILNYTRNPERRFDFDLGIDADDDPIAAIKTGIGELAGLEFVLADPPPSGHIRQVGDSNIVILFAGWIDQRDADFNKSRSVALAATKSALEDAGFALPEPIYRLRFDAGAPLAGAASSSGSTAIDDGEGPAKNLRSLHPAKQPADAANVAPERHIAEKVEEERREGKESDLLSASAPVE